MSSQANALALIIADDGRCDAALNSCGHRFGTPGSGGLGSYDDASLWKDIKIPIFIITSESADKLRRLMEVTRVNIPNLGWQNKSRSRPRLGGNDDDEYADEL